MAQSVGQDGTHEKGRAMHYTGTIWRPPYEADSLLIQATAGCTHRRCRFCTLNEDVPFRFRASPLEEVEADLIEAQTWAHDPVAKMAARLFDRPRPRVRRVFLTGSNPFALKAGRLLEIAGLVEEYFPQVESIGCFSRVDDVGRKSDDDLARLRSAGFDGLTIGVETGDDRALAFMDKGYASADVVRQLGRLDAAGIGYSVFYLVGISGRGRGEEGARRTAEVLNQMRPRIVGANMLTVFPGSPLAGDIAAGRWAEETETEKYREVRELVSRLSIETDFAMGGASNAVFVAGRLPEERRRVVETLDAIVSQVGEEELSAYRKGLRHL